jgi:protein-tyrosine-phosphatase
MLQLSGFIMAIMNLKRVFLGFWKDPVWSKVIAAIIITGLGLLAIELPNLSISGLMLPSYAVAGTIVIGSACILILVVSLYPRRKVKTLVFLSSGGTCRDPMAKAILTKLLEASSIKHRLDVRAVALGPLSKDEVSFAARHVIKEMYNEDVLADHKPSVLTSELVKQADLILAMDRYLLLTPGKALPEEKTYVLKNFFGIKGDIFDP